MPVANPFEPAKKKVRKIKKRVHLKDKLKGVTVDIGDLLGKYVMSKQKAPDYYKEKIVI